MAQDLPTTHRHLDLGRVAGALKDIFWSDAPLSPFFQVLSCIQEELHRIEAVLQGDLGGCNGSLLESELPLFPGQQLEQDLVNLMGECFV